MVAELPPFQEGRHYRQRDPRREGPIYRFQTLRKTRLRCESPISSAFGISFRDAFGHEWLRIDKFGILIEEGYAWNGCSPKRWVPIFGWIGTPDFPSTILASCVHDALYQFHACAHMPWHRSDCDLIFREIIELAGDEDIAAVYHAAVRKFGTWKDRRRLGEHSIIL